MTGGRVTSDNGRMATIAPRRGVDTVGVIVRAADDDEDDGDGDGDGDGGDDSGVGDAGGTTDLPATGGGAVLAAAALLSLGAVLVRRRLR